MNVTATETSAFKSTSQRRVIRSIHATESRGNMDPLVTQIQYDKYPWHVYRDFRMIVHRLALQMDYVRFYCKWDSRTLKSNYT